MSAQGAPGAGRAPMEGFGRTLLLGTRRELAQLTPDDRRNLVLRDAASGVVLATRVGLALGPLRRLRGLLGRAALEEGEALVLWPCRAVHTYFMRFAIDVLFIDQALRVVAAVSELAPWRTTAYQPSAVATIEFAAGTLARTRVALGHAVEFARAG